MGTIYKRLQLVFLKKSTIPDATINLYFLVVYSQVKKLISPFQQESDFYALILPNDLIMGFSVLNLDKKVYNTS